MPYDYISGQIVDEEDTEIKLTCSNNLFVAQISSGTIRGTLVIQDDVSKEELSELGSMISDLMQRYTCGDASSAN